MDRTVVTWVMFLILSLGMIGFTPSIFIGGSEYNPTDVVLPDEFNAWSQMPSYNSIIANLSKYPPSADTEFDFYNEGGSTINILVRWNMFFDGRMRVFATIPSNFSLGSNKIPMVPTLRKSDMVGAWNPTANASEIEFRSVRGMATGYFRDQNDTRNDIDQAWTDGEIEAEFVVASDWESDETLGAREIVIALLTFNLPSVFREIHPLLGFVMSATIMVPLMFIFFSVVMWGLHGE